MRKNIPFLPRIMSKAMISILQNIVTLFTSQHPAHYRVSHYYGDIILHFSKSGGVNRQQRYLPMRESEFCSFLNMAKEIKNQMNIIKKKTKSERLYLTDNED